MCAAARSCPAPATAGHKAHCCFRRGRRLPTVVPTDSRPLSWPPIGALPRNRLASSATGGASPISPTTRPHRASSPRLRRAGCPNLAAATHRALKTPCHCEPVRTLVWQSVLPRARHHIKGTDCHVAALLAMTFFWWVQSMSDGRGRAAAPTQAP